MTRRRHRVTRERQASRRAQTGTHKPTSGRARSCRPAPPGKNRVKVDQPSDSSGAARAKAALTCAKRWQAKAGKVTQTGAAICSQGKPRHQFGSASAATAAWSASATRGNPRIVSSRVGRSRPRKQGQSGQGKRCTETKARIHAIHAIHANHASTR